jgi:undecaprenyl pyrophosphate synthase
MDLLESRIGAKTISDILNSNTFLKKLKQSFWIKLGLFLLKDGPMVQHVAFIMDGNRRFGKKRYNSVKLGHIIGFGKFLEVIFRKINEYEININEYK